MDLKQQYRTEAQQLTPTEEQCERIRARVYEQIRQPDEPLKRRKPLPLKAVAIAGASAACLALVATVVVRSLPSKDLNNATGNAGFQVAESDKTEGMGFDTALTGTAACDDSAANEDLRSTVTGSPSFMGVPNQAVTIEFSEDMSECVVRLGDSSKEYALCDEDMTDCHVEEAKTLIDLSEDRNNLGSRLYFCVENVRLEVYDQDKKLLGVYAEKP